MAIYCLVAHGGNHKVAGSTPALPIVACRRVLEQDTEPPAAPCSLVNKDGSNAEINFSTVGLITD